MAWTGKRLSVLPMREISLVYPLTIKPWNKFTFGNKGNHGKEFRHVYHNKFVTLGNNSKYGNKGSLWNKDVRKFRFTENT